MGNYPLFMIHSDGNANDKPYGEQLIEIAQMMNLKPEKVLMDGGYDSFEMHTRIFEKLGATPIIGLRYDAVLSKTAAEKSILELINKFWKRGSGDCKSFKDKLLFLAKTNKREIVGQYLRNQTIKNLEKVNEILKGRGVCERKHAHIKAIVKFDVVGYKKYSRNLYSMVNFITFQLMSLAHLQNGFQNKTSFARYR